MAARNLPLPSGAIFHSDIFHSDRGSNYTSEEFAKTLGELGIRQSVGRTGICYDNSLAESTNGAVKVELVNREEYPTQAYAEKQVARYIELFYNSRRLHSRLGVPDAARSVGRVLREANNRLKQPIVGCPETTGQLMGQLGAEQHLLLGIDPPPAGRHRLRLPRP